ncbi:hypothetical protein APSETT444_009874 [Aspergillus pseudonomiae]
MTVGDESAGGCIVAVEFNWAAGRGITGPTDPTRRLVRSPAVLTLTTIEVDPHSTRQAYPSRKRVVELNCSGVDTKSEDRLRLLSAEERVKLETFTEKKMQQASEGNLISYNSIDELVDL